MSSMIDKVWKMSEYIRDPNMDGFTQFNQKKKLYELLWTVERELARCQHFYGEDEWMNENVKRVKNGARAN